MCLHALVETSTTDDTFNDATLSPMYVTHLYSQSSRFLFCSPVTFALFIDLIQDRSRAKKLVTCFEANLCVEGFVMNPFRYLFISQVFSFTMTRTKVNQKSYLLPAQINACILNVSACYNMGPVHYINETEQKDLVQFFLLSFQPSTTRIY